MAGQFAKVLTPHFARGGRPAAGAVYGTVSVIAVIAGAAHGSESVGQVFVFAMVSSLVIWAIHLYASVLGQAGPERLRWRAALLHGLRSEIGVLEGALVPLFVLLVGVVGLLEDRPAISLSMWSGVVLLVLMPLVWLRRAATPWWKCLLASGIAGLLGVVLIVFHVVLH